MNKTENIKKDNNLEIQLRTKCKEISDLITDEHPVNVSKSQEQVLSLWADIHLLIKTATNDLDEQKLYLDYARKLLP